MQRIEKLVQWWVMPALLVAASSAALGGASSLWGYSAHLIHKFVSRRLLEGHLTLATGAAMTGHDLQFFNGAAFSNFGYGVPLLQLPFHWLVRAFPAWGMSFFPDRMIFAIYLVATIAFLCAALNRFVAERYPDSPRLTRAVAPGIFLFSVLSFSLYGLLSYRFIVYEETIAYLVVCQLFTLGCYLFHLHSPARRWLVLAGMAASLGLLVRASGIFYLAAWFFAFGLRRKSWKNAVADAATLAAAAMPVVLFWLYSNFVRTGHVLSPGYQNSLPFFDFHYPMVRFGTACNRTLSGMWEVALATFQAMFLRAPDLSPRLQACHFLIENSLTEEPPFIGPVVLVAWLSASLYLALRHRRQLDVFVPVVTFVLIFAGFVFAGMSFDYRYAGDFWPVFFITGAQLLYYARPFRNRYAFAMMLCLLLGASSWKVYDQVLPQTRSVNWVPADKASLVEKAYRAIATAPNVAALPERITCQTAPSRAYSDHRGWDRDCRVLSFTNVYLGVPRKAVRDYQLTFQTDRPAAPRVRVYINGEIYFAEREHNEYRVRFPLDYRRLASPDLLVTIEWTHNDEPPKTKLLEIGLS